MLRFDDFFHLPELDALIAELVADRTGLVVVAGLDSHALGPAGDHSILPSGRTAMFRVLVGEMLSGVVSSALVVAENREAVRVPRSLQRRVRVLTAAPPHSYDQQIRAAAGRRPDLLIVDRLDEASASAAFRAAGQGPRVVAQLDTVCCGAEVTRHLRDLGVPAEDLAQLRWVITVQRMARLCPHCAAPTEPTPGQLARLRQVLRQIEDSSDVARPDLSALAAYHAPGCEQCGFSGRLGDVAIFDIYHAGRTRLPRAWYIWQMTQQGALSLDDLIDHDAEQLYRTYRLLSASARALTETNATLQRKLFELEAANQVLQHRTAALGSLQDLGQALTRSASLADLAGRVCRHARDLCGADRAILYLTRAGETAEILAVVGWDASLLHQQVKLDPGGRADPEPTAFDDWPPGIPTQHADLAGFAIRAGFWVPLLTEHRSVGLLIVQSTQKARFTQAELALLRALANQAALAIQRAELIDTRIREERLQHELELARDVQQSVLPRIFPNVPGYTFAACNQPARQVGGDLYDIFKLDDEHFGVVIADVSGKGMPAALYMALTRSLLLAEARRERSPREVLLSVNRLLREIGDPHMFVTVFYGVISGPSRRLTFARAGHDYPLLLRDGTAVALGGRGIVLGSFDNKDILLSEEQLALAAGDRLVLYTDGLTDVFAPDGQRFELDRLKEVLQRHARQPPEALCLATFADLAAYQGSADQFDDMTLLVIGVED